MHTRLVLILAAVTMVLQAQTLNNPLTLAQAVANALQKHPSVAASKSAVDAAAARRRQAESGRLPKVNFAESFQSGNNPVYVFGSLLTQRQFAARNFALDALNRPDPLNNFQSLVGVEQPLYDAGMTRQARRAADLGKSMAGEDVRATEQQTIHRTAAAYLGVLLAQELVKSAEAAVRSAESDLARAVAIRESGMSTDADVLSVRVHLAAMREQQIQRKANLGVAEAVLNEAMGEPLDARFALTTPLTAAAALRGESEVVVRPELRQAALAAQMAETQVSTARLAYLPQISLRAAFEADRQRFVTRAGANWMAGVTLRWNLFNGYADKARIEEASHLLTRARAMERQAAEGIKLQVRRARTAVESAGERYSVAESAVAQAEESLRITRNRYEAGLTTVTELLRTEAALVDSQSRRSAALHDRRMAAVSLEFAMGTLSKDSEVLQ